MAEIEEKEKQDEMDDIELAELANRELRKKEEEIAKLKKDLAKAKLYSEAEEEEEETLSREECVSRLSDVRTTNYDCIEAVVNLVDLEFAEGRENPLGKNGQEIYDFLKDCIDECGDDKSRFTAVYQSKLGADDPTIALAYKNRNKN